MEDYSETAENTTTFRIMGDFKRFLSSHSDNPSSELTIKENTSKASDVMMRVKMKQIEAAHASSERAHVKANIELESKFEQLTAQNKVLKDKADSLQGKVNSLTTKLLDMQDEVKQMRKDKEAEISKWENSYLHLETLKQEADSRLSEEMMMVTSQNQQLSEHNLMLQSQNNILNLKCEEHYTHMDQYKRSLEASQTVLKDYQETKSKLARSEQQVNRLKQELATLQDTKTLAKTLKEEMNRLRHIEVEFKKIHEENYLLRQNNDNFALLQEKLHSVESKLARAELQCANVPSLEVENNMLTQRIEQLQNMSVTKNEHSSLQIELSSLSQKLSTAQEENLNLKAELSTLRNHNIELNSSIKAIDQKLTEKSEICASLNAQLLRLRKRAGLLAKERDSIREILQSYDAELTMTSHTTQLNKRIENEAASNKRLYHRIEELEDENKKLADEAMKNRLGIKTLESQKELNETPDSPMVSQTMNEENSVLREKIQKYEAERPTLIEKIEQLEAWIEQGKIKGDYNPENTKVIHFAMNPADLAHQKSKQDVANLKEECIRLRQKLREAADGHEVSVAEVESLKLAQEEASRAELRNQRLKEVFTKKIQEFRQACYSLTGYRIDTLNDSQFRLVSMYAESESDYLLFEMNERGEMKLLETEYSTTLTELVNLHLHHQNSIPMFLSAISVNLFSQQTLA
uniref:Mitotic spindle assembly checkpoint protein MAD1 n=1 Tax=Phallusia mammillata TaxID=59560 RepID=A0A6F9DKT1_9ASCI|nr:mitotic spindle assembly checkpoint protein MAD1 [Phallusia mammillata]